MIISNVLCNNSEFLGALDDAVNRHCSRKSIGKKQFLDHISFDYKRYNKISNFLLHLTNAKLTSLLRELDIEEQDRSRILSLYQQYDKLWTGRDARGQLLRARFSITNTDDRIDQLLLPFGARRADLNDPIFFGGFAVDIIDGTRIK